MTSYESRKTVHHIICLTPVIRCTDGDGGAGGGGGGGGGGGSVGQRGRMRIPDSIYRTPAGGGGFLPQSLSVATFYYDNYTARWCGGVYHYVFI